MFLADVVEVARRGEIVRQSSAAAELATPSATVS